MRLEYITQVSRQTKMNGSIRTPQDYKNNGLETKSFNYLTELMSL